MAHTKRPGRRVPRKTKKRLKALWGPYYPRRNRWPDMMFVSDEEYLRFLLLTDVVDQGWVRDFRVYSYGVQSPFPMCLTYLGGI